MYYEDEHPYYRENEETGELDYYDSRAGLYYSIEETKTKKRSYEDLEENND